MRLPFRALSFRLVILLLSLVCVPPIQAQSDASIRQLVRQAADAAVKRDYRRSADLLFKARSQAEATGNYEQLFWVYTNLGINQAELLNYADALQNFTKAHQIAVDHLDKRSVLSIRNNIAGLYMMNHENAKALDEYLKIYADIRSGNDKVLIGGCALNIATLLVDAKRYKEAQSYMEKAESLLGADKRNVLALLSLRTDYLLGTNQPQAAYQLVQLAVAKHPQLSSLPEMIVLRARTAFFTQRYDETVAQAHAALQQKKVDLSMKRAIFELLAQTLAAQHRYEEALHCKDSVQHLADSLTNVTGQKLFEARQIQYDIWKKQQEIDNYQQRHKLELALIALAAVALLVLVWALVVQVRNSRQQRRLAALELQREQQERQILQQQMEQEQANLLRDREEGQRTLELRGRELMSQALQAASRNDALRNLLESLDADSSMQQNGNSHLRQTIAALRHQLDESTEWNDFTTYFEQANKRFLVELHARHPRLTPADIRFLTLIYINLSSKEISLLLNITPEYSKKKRQHLVRKMGLSSTQGLYEYLRSLSSESENLPAD